MQISIGKIQQTLSRNVTHCLLVVCLRRKKSPWHNCWWQGSVSMYIYIYGQPIRRARVSMIWFWLLLCRCITRTYWHVTLTSTTQLWRKTWKCDVLWRTWTQGHNFSCIFFLSVDAVLKNSTLEKFAYIWQIERDFIRGDKDWKNANSCFSVIFSLQSSSWLFKHPSRRNILTGM